MSARSTQFRFWLLAFLGLVALLWALKPMLLPFVAGMTLAYFLDPVVNALSGRKVPRWLGTLLVLLGFTTLVVALLLLIAPLLQSQIVALIGAMPGYVTTLKEHLMPVAETWIARLSPDDVEKLRDAVGQYAGNAVGWAGRLLQELVSGGLALFDILTLLIITPVVAFYLLRDWPRLTQAVDTLLPRKHYTMIRKEMLEIDRTLSGFIRGQALVCLCLGLIYGVGLTLVGLKYGATVGVIAGALSFIPYVGSTFGLVCSLALAMAQFDGGINGINRKVVQADGGADNIQNRVDRADFVKVNFFNG